MLLQKSRPAYKGARFDAEGFCLAHSDVRLCRLTSEGRYKVVCKTCYKCGSAALMTEPNAARTTLHGYKKKAVESRDMRGQLVKKGRSRAEDGRRRRANDTTPNTNGRSKDERRARTLSPAGGKAEKQSLLRKPLSASHAQKIKASSEAIKGVMKIQPPFCGGCSKKGRGNIVRTHQSQSISKDHSRESHSTKSRELTWGQNTKGGEVPQKGGSQSRESHTTKNRESTWGQHAKGVEVLKKRESGEGIVGTSAGVGRCRVHPEVRLATTRTSRGDGGWQISKDVCPHCFPSRPTAAPPRRAKSLIRGIPKSTSSGPAPAFAASPKTARPSLRARSAPAPRRLPFPSPPDTPKDAFSTALVVYKEDAVMRNSTARMARADEKKRRQAELEELQMRRACEAWESLPVPTDSLPVSSVNVC